MTLLVEPSCHPLGDFHRLHEVSVNLQVPSSAAQQVDLHRVDGCRLLILALLQIEPLAFTRALVCGTKYLNRRDNPVARLDVNDLVKLKNSNEAR